MATDTFTDIDAGDILTYSVTAPPWLTFDPATLTFNGIPTNADAGTLNVSVTATDLSGATVTDTFALNIIGTTVNNLPTLENEINTQTATENQLFTFQVPDNTFTDIDGDPLTYTANLAQIGQPDLPLPGWLTFDAASRTFSGTPAIADVGLINLNVVVTDPSGGQAVETFALMVADTTNNPPVVNNSIPNQGAIINRSFIYVLPDNTFTDIDVEDNLTYSATLADGTPLPAWLSFDPLTLIFSAGIVPIVDYGTLDISVTAIDPSSASASDTFALNIDIDTAQYGASYDDLIKVFGYDLPALNQHYREFGRNEGRNPDSFDEYRYLAGYDDLLDFYETNAVGATEHYIVFGSQPTEN